MSRRGIIVLAAFAACAVSQAQITLTHNGSTVNIDENAVSIQNWIFGGVDNVYQNNWYYRDGDAGAASLLSTISAPSVTLFGSRGAEVVYADNNLTVTVSYLLQASSNGMSADLAEQVTVETNFGINLRLFQYNDFDVNGSASGDTGVRQNSSTIDVSDGGYSVTTGGTGIPDFSELSNAWPALRSNIDSTAGYNLNSAAGSNIGESMSGDIAFAYQWNMNLGDGGVFSVSTDKIAAVPEPATFIVLGLGAMALLRRRKRK